MTSSSDEEHPADLEWLKAQIRDLRGALRAVDARLCMLGLDGAANVPEQITALEASVQLLAEDLATALGTGKVGAPEAIDWPRIPNDQYDTELGKLSAWADNVLARYYPGSMPPACWQAHPDVVIDLSLIHLEWKRIYDADHPALKDALDFADRWFPNAIRRIKALTSACAAGTCALKRPGS